MPSPQSEIRIHKRSSYADATIVPNPTAQNSSLSWAARGLLLYCLSLPAGWRIREEDLIGRSPTGRDHLRSIVRELEAAGYVRRTQTRLPNGHVGPAAWEVWDVPREVPTTPPQTGYPSTGKPSTVKSRSRTRKSPQTENPSTAVLYHPTADGLSVDGKSDSIERTTKKKELHKTNTPLTPPYAPLDAPAAPTDTGKPTRRQPYRPTSADVPLPLQPAADALLGFWAAKGGARTERAWNLLCSEAGRIASDPWGSLDALIEQLEAGTQAGWQSLTWRNWQRYAGQGLPNRSTPRYAQQASPTDRVIQYLRAHGQ